MSRRIAAQALPQKSHDLLLHGATAFVPPACAGELLHAIAQAVKAQRARRLGQQSLELAPQARKEEQFKAFACLARQADQIRRRIRALLADAKEPPSFARLVGVVDALRGGYRVDAICAELPISPQDYYAEKSRLADLRWRQLLGASPTRSAVAP